MLDLSRAQNFKNFKSSFGVTADNIISLVTALKSEFNTYYASLNDVRRDRNTIIEKASKIITSNKKLLAENGVVLDKPLSKYDNATMCRILDDASKVLTGSEKETVEICKIQINNRFNDIVSMSIQLESLMNKLSNMSVLEEDAHEEVVIDFNAIRKKKGLSEDKPEKEEITETSNPIISNEEPVIPALETFNESLEETKKVETIIPEIEPEEIISEVSKEPERNVVEEEPILIEEIEEEVVEEPIIEETEDIVEEPETPVSEIEEIVPEEIIEETVEETIEDIPEVNEIADAIADEVEEKIYQTMSIKPIDDTLVKENVADDIIEENDEGLEQVVGIKQASPQLIAIANELIIKRAEKHVKQYTDVNTSYNVENDIIGDDDLFAYDTDTSSGLTRDLNDFVEDDDVAFVQKEDDNDNIIDYLNYVDQMNQDDVVSFDNQDEDSMPFTLDDKLTLDEIANNVYGDADLWQDLYKFGPNKAKIDKRARESHVSVSTAATNPGYLAGLELNFPVELVTYEEVPEDNYRSRYSYESAPRGRSRGRAA